MAVIRSLMVSAGLAVLLVASMEGFAQCPEDYKISNERKLDFLNKEFDRKSRDSVDCAITLMDQLSQKGERRVIPVLIRNLDLEQTYDRPLFKAVPFGEYPAISDLTLFEEVAVPALLDAIAQNTAGSVLSQNATIALMGIERTDSPAGIKLLLDRAAKERGAACENLKRAARYAVSFCGRRAEECRDSLREVR